MTIVHEFNGNQCTITLAATTPTNGWVTEHLPVGTGIVSHDGDLVIDDDPIEPGTTPHRFAFEEMTDLTITYVTDQPVEKELWYWVGNNGKSYFGYN